VGKEKKDLLSEDMQGEFSDKMEWTMIGLWVGGEERKRSRGEETWARA